MNNKIKEEIKRIKDEISKNPNIEDIFYFSSNFQQNTYDEKTKILKNMFNLYYLLGFMEATKGSMESMDKLKNTK